MDHPSLCRVALPAGVRRRPFLLVSVAGLPAMTFAQTTERRVRIAFLSGGSSDANVQRDMVDPFVLGLRALGYADGQNTAIDWRWAQGRPERLPALLAASLRLEPDVLVAVGPRPAELAKDMGPVVPVVALAVNNPVLDGLAVSLARPGGHITGVSSWGIELVAKRLQLLKDLVPGAHRVAVLSNPVTVPDNQSMVKFLADRGPALGMEIRLYEAREAAQYDAAFGAMARDRMEGVLVLADAASVAALRAGMAERGHVEGRSYVLIDTWWGEGSLERLTGMRDDMLRTQPDVIVAQGGVALAPMLHASVTRPLVFSMSGDPVLAGIVASYGKPGGNRSGITLFAAELIGKRLALLQEVVPGMRRIAVIANSRHPGAVREIASARTAGVNLGLAVTHFPSQSVAELDAALVLIKQAHLDAILVLSDGFALNQAQRIAEFSRREKIPVVAGWATFAQRGNLMSYGPEFEDVHRRLASYVDRIRKGAKPGDLPIEQPTKFELVVHLGTARALGLTIPQSVLLQADKVIQ